MKSFIRSVDKCELFTVTVPKHVQRYTCCWSCNGINSQFGDILDVLHFKYWYLDNDILARHIFQICPMFVLQGWPFPKIFLKINHYVIINSYIIGEIEVAIYGECNNVLMHLHQVL